MASRHPLRAGNNQPPQFKMAPPNLAGKLLADPLSSGHGQPRRCRETPWRGEVAPPAPNTQGLVSTCLGSFLSSLPILRLQLCP